VLFLSGVYGYGFPDSISATYYVPTCITPFMIILGSAGLLLFSYKGYEKHDDIICSFAGLAGLMICIFSCDLDGYIDPQELVGTFQIPAGISGWIHNISAVVFFCLLAYNSLFLFTKSSGEMTPNKKKRNLIYKVCGIGMLVSLVMIVPISIFNIWGGTWAVETVALAFFGVSWLTKADMYPWLFCDKKD
jgi:hypothetical protein